MKRTAINRIAGPQNFTLTADQVVGKYLKAKKPYREYAGYPNSNDFQDIPAGQIVGLVFSWVMRGTSVWWQFKYTDGGMYYVKHEKGLFDEAYLASQFPDGQLPAQPKMEIPNWLVFAAAGFSWYQSTEPGNAKYKLPYQAGAIAAAAFGISQFIGKVDFNPFD